MEVKINNLVSIKGYDAGKNMNRLVSLQDDSTFDAYPVKCRIPFIKKQINIYESLLITAVELDVDSASKIADRVDLVTPYNEILIISKKFTKLPKKEQLALLNKYNAFLNVHGALSFVASENQSIRHAQVRAEIETVTKYGARVCKSAFRKDEKVKERVVMRVGKAYRKDYKNSKKAVNETESDQPEVSII